MLHMSITTLLKTMHYEDHVDSKTVRNILKEVFPEAVLADAVLIANARPRAKKILIGMERESMESYKECPYRLS